MTAGAWSVRLLAAALIALPLPLPLPTPGVSVSPGLPVATPSLPLPATPSLQSPPAVTPAPTGSAGSSVAAPTAQAGSGTAPVANPSEAPGRIRIPFTAMYVSSPLDVALIAALATLPLLFGIWLLLFGRTLREARRRRDAHVRLMLAADLGLHPRDVANMSTRALFDLREKSAFDELTGVLRRAAGVSMAEREIARARRHNTTLTVAFVDVDGLEEANDAGGRGAGDELLRGLTKALREGLRAQDAIVRFGGDEFVCVLPDTTARDARFKLGAIQDQAAAQGIRFCAGLAQLQRSDDVVSLFARADRDLYEFKANRGEIVPLPSRPRDAEGTVTA